MDPLTHGLLGASIGQACHGRSLGRRALVWGAVLAMAPDVDIGLSHTGPFAEWTWHRGVTHALWFELLAGWLLGLGLWRWQGGPRAAWTSLAVVTLLSHPLLDACTTYGTQLLAPFSNRRFAIDAIAIVDPAYSLALVAGIVVGVRAGVASPAARRAAWTVVAATTAYLGLGLGLNQATERLARRQLAARGLAADRVEAYPTLLQLPYRRVVARSGDAVRVGFVTLLRPRAIEWESFTQASGPAVDAARATPEGRLFEWFAMGEATPRVEAEAGGWRVELDDLRYGLPGRPRDGIWGLRVRVDAAGRALGPAERFDRPLDAPISRVLLLLWRETLGLG